MIEGVLAALILVGGTIDVDPPAAARSAAYRSCVRASGGREVQVRQCAADEASRADQALNVGYGRIMRRLDTAARQRLRIAQRRWIGVRTNTCNARYRAELPGQQASAIYQLCMADAAANRLAVLTTGR